ncbi:helicase-related protein [Bacillus pumilus]|uniref:helicase-related protein n=1 Tax=Bacillus pumilus TaxID=1408 RepID=UPI00017A5E29|nr:SNF2-related protein [Bacillus pumilus]EDW22206.1 ATP-dependent helicase hepa [Bacillus pumilus ATCC 7061]MCR4352497.1 helicase-related protein [Bacillus pumilus]MCY7504306.1 SNF2-related protein [Bacillus pumilus]MED4629599.1 helicase-related protein [Bacillus pumilus]MED4674392.1 helicase-related protein [Bacillus pumilus]
MKIDLVDNKGNNTLVHVMKGEIKNGSEIAVASAKLSMNIFKELKKTLAKGESFRFLFTEQTFYQQEIDDNHQFKLVERKGQQLDLEGNQFEIPLRNQMQSKQIARELSEWINQHAQFKTILGDSSYPKQIMIKNKMDEDIFIQSEIEFTADGLGITSSKRQASYTVMKETLGVTKNLLAEFDLIWKDETKSKEVTAEVLEQLDAFQKENAPEWLYFVTLYNIFTENLEGLSEDNILKEGLNFKDTFIWNKLYPFQRDGVIGMIDKMENYNGCILADSVGLGKTFSALAVIKYYELRNDRVLVLCPKKLRDNWAVYTQNDKRNVLNEDRFNYDVLNHTDLNRESGMSGEIRLDTINWSNYDLVVIDESHNFRNNNAHKGRITRYQKLMQEIIKKGVKTKVLLLSATPVNNKMNDIKNQIAFITEDNDKALKKEGIDSIEQTLRTAQASFNRWTALPSPKRTTEEFLIMVEQDYFQLLDLLTIARSRKHIEKYYNVNDIGSFPTRLKPLSIKADVDTEHRFVNMNEVNERLESLNFSIYQPMKYVLPHKRKYYEELYDTRVKGGQSTFKQTDREFAVAALMKVNLFKRLESSIHSFRLTLKKLVRRIEDTLQTLQLQNQPTYSEQYDDTELDDEQLEAITVGSDKVQIQLNDIDALKWAGDLRADLATLQDLLQQATQISTIRDAKLEQLVNLIKGKIKNPINPGNKKVIIFSAFADTAKYLYDNLSERLLNKQLHSALVVGSGANKCTLKGVRVKDINDILMNFSPKSKERYKVDSKRTDEIDILFATDCISEGQNLQDCDYLINYDIHWNPVRVIQRFGRIDRIGSTNTEIQLVNFWPNMELDEYINLEERVKGRMKILNTSASGEEDILDTTSKEMNDLEYRRNQLKALQNDVLNLEDVSGAISITDLTYTDFKSDLSAALKLYKKELAVAPKGLYSVISNADLPEAKPGVIFCFKQHKEVALESNSLAQHILLYVTNDGEAFIHYTHAKKILDAYRKLTLGKQQPELNSVEWFNKKTNDAADMEHYQDLLKQSIDIIKDKQEEVGFESLFSFGSNTLQGQLDVGGDEIELISFLVVKDEA